MFVRRGINWCVVVFFVRLYVVLCGVAWCGMALHGVVWCGVVWCGVVWCGVVCYCICGSAEAVWQCIIGVHYHLLRR